MIKNVLDEDKDILQIPLTPRAAMKLGMSPCDGCNFGWAIYSDKKEPRHCHDECRYWKEHWEEKRKKATGK